MKSTPGLLLAASAALFHAGCAATPGVSQGLPIYSIDCADLANRTSRLGEESYVVKFRNTRNSPLDVFWVNYEGVEEQIGSVAAGEILAQDTFVTHPWVIRDPSGMCVAAYDSASSVIMDIR